MPKIEVSAEILRLLKIQSALSGQKMQDLANSILKAGLSEDVKVLSERWNKPEVCTIEQEDEEEEEEEIAPQTPETKIISLRLLKKLKDILEKDGKVTNRDLVLDEPDISKSGKYLIPLGIETNKSRFYTRDQLPLIEDAIKKLEEGE